MLSHAKAFMLANAVVFMSDVNMQMSCCYLTRCLCNPPKKACGCFSTASGSGVVRQRDYGCRLGSNTQSFSKRSSRRVCGVWCKSRDLFFNPDDHFGFTCMLIPVRLWRRRQSALWCNGVVLWRHMRQNVVQLFLQQQKKFQQHAASFLSLSFLIASFFSFFFFK